MSFGVGYNAQLLVQYSTAALTFFSCEHCCPNFISRERFSSFQPETVIGKGHHHYISRPKAQGGIDPYIRLIQSSSFSWCLTSSVFNVINNAANKQWNYHKQI